MREVDHLRDRNSGMLSLPATRVEPSLSPTDTAAVEMFPACFPPGLSLVSPPCSSPPCSPVFAPCCPRGCPLCCGFGMCWLLTPLPVYPSCCASRGWRLILGPALLLMQCRSCPRNAGSALHPDVSCAHPGLGEQQGFGSPGVQECRACALRVLLLPP